jgi:peptidyl-prolyl cis-trans isomerase A (cyclophilin A)
MKLLITLFLFCGLSLSASAQIVRMETVLGNIDIELRPDVAPLTVANFLRYVNDGDYDNSYFHRSVRNFIIQGGGFTYINGQSGSVTVDAPIINESSLSLPNLRGTISMARTSNVDSATSQWFFNTVDNSNLDGNGDGYAVFGSVIAGMEVVDAIAALPIVRDFSAPINEIPLIDYTSGIIQQSNLVLITQAYVLDSALHINQGLNGNWLNTETSGQGMFFDYFPGLDKMFMGWFTFDTVNLVEGVSANLGNANQRWLTGLGNINHETNTVTFDMVSTSGGLFDNPQTVTNSDPGSIGTVTISFADCANATVNYNLTSPAVSGSFQLTSIASVIGENNNLCEYLSRQAATSR